MFSEKKMKISYDIFSMFQNPLQCSVHHVTFLSNIARHAPALAGYLPKHSLKIWWQSLLMKEAREANIQENTRMCLGNILLTVASSTSPGKEELWRMLSELVELVVSGSLLHN